MSQKSPDAVSLRLQYQIVALCAALPNLVTHADVKRLPAIARDQDTSAYSDQHDSKKKRSRGRFWMMSIVALRHGGIERRLFSNYQPNFRSCIAKGLDAKARALYGQTCV